MRLRATKSKGLCRVSLRNLKTETQEVVLRDDKIVTERSQHLHDAPEKLVKEECTSCFWRCRHGE
jgi:hypothetical protein